MTVGTAAGVVLGLIFLLAGGSKLASTTWPVQARELGAPGPLAAALPYAEVALGAVLVTGVARRPAAGLAALVLVAFTSLLAVRIAEGRRPPCACFGGRTPRPIGPSTLLRNACFLAIAVTAVAVG